jgi:hypothetical protein
MCAAHGISSTVTRFQSLNAETTVATQSNKDAHSAQRIERKVADEGNLPATSSSLIGAAVLLVAILFAIGLLYLATKVPAAVLAAAPSQPAKTSH